MTDWFQDIPTNLSSLLQPEDLMTPPRSPLTPSDPAPLATPPPPSDNELIDADNQPPQNVARRYLRQRFFRLYKKSMNQYSLFFWWSPINSRLEGESVVPTFGLTPPNDIYNGGDDEDSTFKLTPPNYRNEGDDAVPTFGLTPPEDEETLKTTDGILKAARLGKGRGEDRK